jgi:hypothetical protein
MSDEDARRPTHGAPAVDAVDAGDAVDACATGNATPRALLDMVRLVRARERGYLASLLHDGPIQELAVVALELGEVCRAMGASPSDKPNGLVWQVHAAGRTLCRLQEELWPFPRRGSGLIETLQQRTAWLLATPLAVAADEGAAELSEADIEAVADVTELILVGLGNAEVWDHPIVAVRADPDLIFLQLNMTPPPGCSPASGDPAAAKAWLHRLAAAIQARANVVLDDRRLRIGMEMPRSPTGRSGSGLTGDPIQGVRRAGRR